MKGAGMDQLSYRISFVVAGEPAGYADFLCGLAILMGSQEGVETTGLQISEYPPLSTEKIDRTNGQGDLPLEDLQLPTRIFNSLRLVGIETVGDLCDQSVHQLLAIPNFRHQSLNGLLLVMMDRGLRLRTD